MASNNSIIKVLKNDLELEQKINLEIKQVITDCTIPSSVEFDQELGDFKIRFDHFVDNILKKLTVVVSVTYKLLQGNFDVVAELEGFARSAVDSKSSVSGNCILRLDFSYLHLVKRLRNVSVTIKITSSRTSEKTRSTSDFTLSDFTNATKEVYVLQNKFANDLYNSRESTGDVSVVTTSNIEHKAHKLILGIRSPFFKTMFEVHLKERLESTVKIDNFADDLVVSLIEFMYTGWTACVGTNPEGLLQIAHMYQVEDLVKACWDSLMRTLNVKSAVDCFRLSGKFDDKGSYKKKIGRFLFRNFEVIRKTEEFAAAVKEDTDLFVEICRLEDV